MQARTEMRRIRGLRGQIGLGLAGLLAGLVAQLAHGIELADVAAGTRADLRIDVPAGDADDATFIPVTVLRGASPGPTLLLVAGVHGYEFHSILALAQLAQALEPTELAGTLVLVRTANVAAFEERSPYVNPDDRKNLNRAFPGRPDGSQTERIAHALSTELIAHADFVADLHSGDGAEWLEAFVGVYGGPLATDYAKALAFAEAMGFPNLVRYSMESQVAIDRGRSLNRQAVAAGKATVLVEIGENGERDPLRVAQLVRGLRAAMGSLGMLPGAALEANPAPRLFEGEVSVPVEHSGVWYPEQTVGRFIEKGEALGEIRDYSGALLEIVRAPVSGYAIYGLAGPPVRAGDSVMAITRPIASLR
jgi:predicted deacylase